MTHDNQVSDEFLAQLPSAMIEYALEYSQLEERLNALDPDDPEYDRKRNELQQELNLVNTRLIMSASDEAPELN